MLFLISTQIFAPLGAFQSPSDNCKFRFPKRSPPMRSASFAVHETSEALCKRKKSQRLFVRGLLSEIRIECCSSLRCSFANEVGGESETGLWTRSIFVSVAMWESRQE